MSDVIASVAGIIISLVCSYVPGVRDKFGALDPTQKRLCILCALFASAIIIGGASCVGIIDAIECTREGAFILIRSFVVAMVASQGIYMLSTTSSASKTK